VRTDSPISFRVSSDWLEALDKWREEQPVRPSRTAVIVAAVEFFIASHLAACDSAAAYQTAPKGALESAVTASSLPLAI
jgi:hypothetical protein